MKTVSVNGWILTLEGSLVRCSKQGRGEFYLDSGGRQIDRQGIPYAGPIPVPPEVRAEAMRLLGMCVQAGGVQ